MRILHTSDWHLGRSFHRVDMLSAQAAQLDHLAEVVRSEKVDVLVVAGDVYDRALPSVDTVALLDSALDSLLDTGVKILMTSGNHDSAVRLGFGSRRNERAGLHLRTQAVQAAVPLMLEDEHGPVALYGIPYLEPALVAEEMGVARSHAAVLGEAMAGIRADLATRGARSVVAAHAFVVGGEACESERDIRVGGVDTAPRAMFDDVDYVALGHLHGRQSLSETVHYSGSPLPYSFSEANHRKGSLLVELGATGVTRVEALESPVYRRLAVLRGTLPELLTDARHTAAEDAFCQITLTDADRPRDAMEQIRRRFPHALSLVFEPGGGRSTGRYPTRVTTVNDEELCCDFLRHVRSHEESEAERALLQEALESVRTSAVLV